MSKQTNIEYDQGKSSFMKDIQKTLVQQPDYKGMGGHGLENHGPHGPHTQISIGMGTKTINFREKT